MSAENLACLGKKANFEACFGPDPKISREIGDTACMSCVVAGFRELSKKTELLSEENENLRDQAERDSLTELLNRRMFDLAIEQRINAGDRFGLLFVDVESFSEVNARLRHVGGDEVLRGTARYLERFFSDNLRDDDFIGRIGGDEFGVILSPSREGGELDDPQMAVIQERMTAKFLEVPIVQDYNERFGDSAPLGLHVGYSIWEPGKTAEFMHAEADPKANRYQPQIGEIESVL